MSIIEYIGMRSTCRYQRTLLQSVNIEKYVNHTQRELVTLESISMTGFALVVQHDGSRTPLTG